MRAFHSENMILIRLSAKNGLIIIFYLPHIYPEQSSYISKPPYQIDCRRNFQPTTALTFSDQYSKSPFNFGSQLLIISLQPMKKTLIIFLSLICIISLRIHQEEPKQPRLRRSIHTLNETERKSLFWSIKMMAVVPAPASFRNRTFVSFTRLPQGNATMQPQRVVDILISHHSSSCEHSSFYFGFFHRHLMIMSQVWLNYVHSILRGGKTRLLQLYKQDIYLQHQQEWDAVFEDYVASGAAGMPFITLHYWNPTNYKNRDDLLVPIELSSPTMYPKKQLDAVDRLYKAVLGYWPWETNVKTKLTSPNFKGSQAQLEKQLEDLQVFDRIGETNKLTPDEQNFYNFSFTPRKQPEEQDFDDFVRVYRNFQNIKNRNGTFISHTRNRYRRYYQTVGKRTLVPLCAVTEQDDYIMYGGQVQFQKEGKLMSVSQQYISKEERRRLNLNSANVKDYNGLLPHYSAAHGFFNKQTLTTFKDYLKKTQGIEWAHSQMHGYKGIFLKDGLYSILTLFFYPFHSWIDALLQTKIRLSNYEDRAENGTHYKALKDYLQNGDKKNEIYRLKMIVDQQTDAPYKEQASAILNSEFQNFYAQLAQNKQSIFPTPVDPSKVGSHLVIEWTNHFINTTLIENKTVGPAFIAAYPMRDIMLTPHRLRTSKQLGDLYRNTYVKNHGWRFEGLIDIANFPFDYDYQVYNGHRQVNPTLDENSSNMAKYFRDMRQDMYDTYDLLLPPLRDAIQTIVARNVSEFSIDSSQEKTILVTNPQAMNQNLAAYYQPLVTNTSFTYVHYPAAIPPLVYPLIIKFNQQACLSRVQDLLKKWKVSSELTDELKKGIEAQDLNVRRCREKCTVDKRIILQLGADLLETNRSLWRSLRALQLGEDQVLKDSRHPSYFQCLSQTLKIAAPQGQAEIQASFLRGTERIRLFVELQEVPDEKRALLEKKIKVIAKASAAGEEGIDTLSIRSQAMDAEDAKFYFWTIEASKQPKVTNHIDALLYKKIQVLWNNVVVLDFDIPFYSKSANFRLFVGLDESSGPFFRLEDADFAVKEQFLVQAWPRIHD